MGSTKIRIINTYRSFRPPGGKSASEFFKFQLEILRTATSSNCFIMGDFNLDGGMNIRQDYGEFQLLVLLHTFAHENNI